MSARWDVLYEEPATGRTLEGRTLLEEYDLRYVSLLAPALEWFLTAIQTVRASIEDGIRAKLAIGRLCVYRRLRVQHGSRPGSPAWMEEIRGIVVPELRTTFFTHRGTTNLKVLYEETAHSYVYPIPDPDDPEHVRFERYKCHLVIYEGLRRSAFFIRLSHRGQSGVRRLRSFLIPRCRMKDPEVVDPCSCTL